MLKGDWHGSVLDVVKESSGWRSEGVLLKVLGNVGPAAIIVILFSKNKSVT